MQLGSSFCELWAYLKLGYVDLQQDELSQARVMFESAIRHSQEKNNIIRLICGVAGFASLAFHEGRDEGAVRLLGYSAAMRKKIHHQRPPIEQVSVQRELAIIQSKLSYSKNA